MHSVPHPPHGNYALQGTWKHDSSVAEVSQQRATTPTKRARCARKKGPTSGPMPIAKPLPRRGAACLQLTPTHCTTGPSGHRTQTIAFRQGEHQPGERYSDVRFSDLCAHALYKSDYKIVMSFRSINFCKILIPLCPKINCITLLQVSRGYLYKQN